MFMSLKKHSDYEQRAVNSIKFKNIQTNLALLCRGIVYTQLRRWIENIVLHFLLKKSNSTPLRQNSICHYCFNTEFTFYLGILN